MQVGLIQRYLGNKSSIAPDIVALVRSLSEPGDTVVDAFSGSLAATFAMRQAGLRVVPNDINHFSWLFATAFLTGSQPIGPNGRLGSPGERHQQWRALADELVAPVGHGDAASIFRTDIYDHYCEEGGKSSFLSARGRSGRRRFFSADNAATIDRALSRIRFWWRNGRIDQRTRCILSAMLISGVERVSNTQGTYHDFPREFIDTRALRPLKIEVPPDEIFLGPESPLIGRAEDSLDFVRRAPAHRVLYLDPPYNFRQYTSYYFMLNLLSKHAEVDDLDEFFSELEYVRGQNMADDFKSTFCSKKAFMPSLRTIIERADTEHVVISYFDGRNHWGSFKSEHAESDGRKAIEEFLASDLFEAGSARCIPVDRLNYQSYGGFKAKKVSEYLFTARTSSIIANERRGEVLEWTGKALG
ncbi:adenine-specific DNA methylase [Aquamicrobium lusatiense]|jgi:adenine-specific DNA-methyltransferase|uniref:site-specific DNA-methyltransferase (adenine-specific) n=1 Tax=Aquamicrobium lusatiense TaxID=89772 RepID=A0A7W9VUV8_9HYPH|nr:DNA adenine methylase [Aquamicrobium lusatiense]MBB6012438.1 adenine-specific DNA methylase [Aquamicrobium lusatiense]